MKKFDCQCQACQCDKKKVKITTSQLIEQVEDQTLPFTEIKIENKMIRSFDPSADPHLFKWHWDAEDRLVEILSGDGWRFQFDNEIPIVISKGDTISIPKGVYHRLIAGDTELRVLITEIYK